MMALSFFNFRPDRARQLTQAFVKREFTGFERDPILPLTVCHNDAVRPVFSREGCF